MSNENPSEFLLGDEGVAYAELRDLLNLSEEELRCLYALPSEASDFSADSVLFRRALLRFGDGGATVSEVVTSYIAHFGSERASLPRFLDIVARILPSESFEALGLDEDLAWSSAVRARHFPIVAEGDDSDLMTDHALGCASYLGSALLVVSLADLDLCEDEAEFAYMIRSLSLFATLYAMPIFIDATGGLRTPYRRRLFGDMISENMVILAHCDPSLRPEDATLLPVSYPSREMRRKCWSEALSEEIADFASHFTLRKSRIFKIASRVKRMSGRKAPDSDLIRRLCEDDNVSVAGRDIEVIAVGGERELILTENQREVFEEALYAATLSRQSEGDSLPLLFFGPHGTGKTLATKHFAYRANLKLWRIDLRELYLKYGVGTAARLGELLAVAAKNPVLAVIDSADFLFEYRKGSNIPDVASILDRMRESGGVSVMIVTSDVGSHDDVRRCMRYSLRFPSPDAGIRARLFEESMHSMGVPAKSGIAYDMLAGVFQVNGEQIHRIVQRALIKSRREEIAIGLNELVEISREWCSEQGMLQNENMPMALTNAMRAEIGLKALTPDEYETLHRPLLSPEYAID